MRQFLITLTIISFFILPSFASAEDSVDSAPKDPMEKRQETRDAFKDKRKEVRENIKDKRVEIRENIKEKRQALREDIKKKREEMHESIKEKREEFKNRLQILKDEKKKAIVERLDTKMSTINTNTTDRMLTHLEKMEDILGRLQEKLNAFAGEGKDTAAAQSAISTAQGLIESAKAAVSNQAGKDYTPGISDETTLRAVVGTSKSGLRSDLSALHKQVVDAKQATMKAVMETAKLRGQKLEAPTEPTAEPTVAL